MEFTFKVWRFRIEVDVFDIDPTFGNLACRIILSWKN